MDKYDISGELKTWSERVLSIRDTERLKERLKDLRKEVTEWINSLEVVKEDD